MKVQFIGSFPSYSKGPTTDWPEFAFIGRSNVGKSSLINYLLERRKIAHISSQPGKTQSINYYEVDGEYYFVDLPGYGYAKQSKKNRRIWEIMVRNYLKKRMQLYCVFLLIDASIPPQDLDLEFVNWLGEHQVPFQMVFTKIDKRKQLEVEKNVSELNQKLLENWEYLPQQYFISNVKRIGREELIEAIHEMVIENKADGS